MAVKQQAGKLQNTLALVRRSLNFVYCGIHPLKDRDKEGGSLSSTIFGSSKDIPVDRDFSEPNKEIATAIVPAGQSNWDCLLLYW